MISQVDTVKLLKGAEAGGAVTITVNDTEFGIAAAASLSTARDNLLNAIQSNIDLSQITASAVGADSFTLKANIGGQAIITSSSDSDLATIVDTVKNGQAVYQPNPNFNGTDSFTYTVSNGLNPPSFSSAKVNVSVSPENDAPEAVIDFGEAVTSQGVTVNVLANDSDIDGDKLSVASLTYDGAADSDASGGLQVVGTNATVQLNENGTVTYVPTASVYNALAAGQTATDKFAYTVSDGTVVSNPVEVTIKLTGQNDAPTASAATITVNEDEVASTSQFDIVTLSGTPEVGDIYSVSVNGNTISYTVDSGDNLTAVRNGLVTALNNDNEISASALSLIHI